MSIDISEPKFEDIFNILFNSIWCLIFSIFPQDLRSVIWDRTFLQIKAN